MRSGLSGAAGEAMILEFTEDRLGEVAFIGDVHGCYLSLIAILSKIQAAGAFPVFLGDLADRGPDSLAALRSVRELCLRGEAMCVLGNHDRKLRQWLRGNKVTLSHGLQGTVEQIMEYSDVVERTALLSWLEGLPVCIRTPSWVAVHAAYEEDLPPGKFKSLCIYGETSGKQTPDGFPERLYGWRDRYCGSRKLIVHGHDILRSRDPRITVHGDTRVVNVDTGAYDGYPLSAYLYPTGRLIQVPGRHPLSC